MIARLRHKSRERPSASVAGTENSRIVRRAHLPPISGEPAFCVLESVEKVELPGRMESYFGASSRTEGLIGIERRLD